MSRAPLRIAFLSFEYPPETGFGGIGTYTRDLARSLVELGESVHVIAGASSPGKATSMEEGVCVTRFKLGRPYRKVFDWLWDHEFPSASRRFETALSMYLCFRELHARCPFDVVEMPCCGAEGALVCSIIKDVKKVLTFHGPMYLIGKYYDNNRIDLALTCWMEGMAIKKSDKYVTLSRALANRVRQDLHIQKPVEVIPLGLDPAALDSVPEFDVRCKYGIPQDAPLILVLGRVEPRKGTHLLKNIIPIVARCVPQSRFVAVGRILYPDLHRDVIGHLKQSNLDKSVLFTGHVDFPDMINFLRSADIFLLPSLWENFPKTLLDAMGLGKAIVAASVGGVPEMIDDGRSGLLAKPGCAPGLAEKIIEMLNSPQLARRCGEEAYRAARRRFNHIEVAKRKVDLYSS